MKLLDTADEVYKFVEGRVRMMSCTAVVEGNAVIAMFDLKRGSFDIVVMIVVVEAAAD